MAYRYSSKPVKGTEGKSAIERYYAILERESEKINGKDRESLRAYNEFKRQLRHEMLDND